MRPLVLCLLAALTTAAAADLPPDEAYVRLSADGHLQLAGQPVRYWGLVSAWAGRAGIVAGDDAAARAAKSATARARVDRFVDRLGTMGYNLVRCWEGRYPQQADEVPLQNNHGYQPGDGSSADLIAYGLHRMEQAGVKIWMSSLNGLGTFGPDEVGVVDDPATAEAWKAAVAALPTRKKGKEDDREDALPSLDHVGKGLLAACVDPRIEALMLARMRRIADFPNKYKGGLRLADDPQIVVWELSNEHFPFRHFFNGDWLKLPPFFRSQFVARWNDFLRQRYRDDEGLRAAWGFLLPGESLTDGSVLLLPLAKPTTGELAVNDANPEAVERARGMAHPWTRDHFTRQRGSDVVAFACELIIAHKQRLDRALRGFGRSCRLSPLIYDSGNDFSIHAAWMHQHADAVSTCSYTKNMGHDPHARRFPFFSQLDLHPGTSWGIPWFEQSSALGKPHFVYETMIDNRSKYRAEYPLRVAALAAIQDWDIVIWHTYPGNDVQVDKPKEPFPRAVVHGFDYFTIRGDEVMQAALRSAGEIFRHRLVPPAPAPRVFTFGSGSLFDPVAMDYGRSYGQLADRFIGTTYRHGSRVLIDPTRADDAADGPTIRLGLRESNPLKPTDEITFDSQRSCMTFDAPGVASYTGFLGDYRSERVAFRNGAAFSGISVANPEGIAYPVTPDERYVTINLTAADGLPLAQSRRVTLTAVSTSFNRGFTLDLTKSNHGRQTDGPADTPPQEWKGAWMSDPGKGPPLVARVAATIECPALDGMRWRMIDFQDRVVGEGVVAGGRLAIPADREVWIVELTRE